MVALVGVSKVYGEGEGEVAAVSDVSVDLGETDYTAIMGPSGCGKSTLLSMAGGLLRPDSGAVFSGGTDVFALDDEELHAFRRKSVGYVFQEFNLISMLSAAENVALPLELDGVPNKAAMERATSVLESLGIGHLARRSPGSLSGGQAQRVAVGRAIAAGQDVLLADEPTGALDSASTETLLDVFDELVERNVKVVIVTHDPVVAQRANRVLSMADGRIVAEQRR